MDVFDSIVKAFDHVSSNSLDWSRDSVLDAVSLSKAMLNFEFIITLHTVERYLSYAESLTRSLQARALDLVQAIKHIDTLKAGFERCSLKHKSSGSCNLCKCIKVCNGV